MSYREDAVVRRRPDAARNILGDQTRPRPTRLIAEPVDSFGSGDEIVQLGRAFFSRLDLEFNPGIRTTDTEISTALTQLRDLLKRRLFLRRLSASGRDAGISLPKGERVVVERTSSSLLALLHAVFGSNLLDGLVQDRIHHTHVRFAAGGLRTRHPRAIRASNNVPDGAAIFLYPEFGFLAIDHGIEVVNWHALLPILVGMTGSYLEAHLVHPRERPRIPRRFDEYGEPPDVSGFHSQLDGFAEELRRNLRLAPPPQLADTMKTLILKAFNDAADGFGSKQ